MLQNWYFNKAVGNDIPATALVWVWIFCTHCLSHQLNAGWGNPDMNACKKSIPTLELLQESPIPKKLNSKLLLTFVYLCSVAVSIINFRGNRLCIPESVKPNWVFYFRLFQPVLLSFNGLSVCCYQGRQAIDSFAISSLGDTIVLWKNNMYYRECSIKTVSFRTNL